MDFVKKLFKDRPDLSTPLTASELNNLGNGVVEGITKAERALPALDTAGNFSAFNSILAQGRRAYETDTGKWKTGDGTTHYNDLPYDDASFLLSLAASPG